MAPVSPPPDVGGPSAATHEELITSRTEHGLGIDEVVCTIGQARLLDPAMDDQRRLLDEAIERIETLGQAGLSRVAADARRGGSV